MRKLALRDNAAVHPPTRRTYHGLPGPVTSATFVRLRRLRLRLRTGSNTSSGRNRHARRRHSSSSSSVSRDAARLLHRRLDVGLIHVVEQQAPPEAVVVPGALPVGAGPGLEAAVLVQGVVEVLGCPRRFQALDLDVVAVQQLPRRARGAARGLADLAE